MGVFDNVGRGIVAIGQSLIAKSGDAKAPAAAPKEHLSETVGGFIVRGWRRGGIVEFDALLEGQVVEHTRRAVGGDDDLRAGLSRFAERFKGHEAEWKVELEHRARVAKATAEAHAKDLLDASQQMEVARAKAAWSEAKLPAAVWKATRAAEWLARRQGRSPVVPAEVAAKLGLQSGQATVFPSEWLEAAALGGAHFAGWAGAGRDDVERVVVVRFPEDAVRYQQKEGEGVAAHYVCVPGGARLDSMPGLLQGVTTEQENTLAWQLREVLAAVGGGWPPLVVVGAREGDERFVGDVERVVQRAGAGELRVEGWVAPGTVKTRVVEDEMAPAPEGERGPTQDRRVLAKAGFHQRVIGSQSFDAVLLARAVDELAGVAVGEGWRLGPVPAEVKRIVVMERAADALAYHQISGERAGTVYAVAESGAAAAGVVRSPSLEKALAAGAVVEAAFEAGLAGAAKARELRETVGGVCRVERREPTHGRFWFDVLVAKNHAKVQAR